MANSVEQQYPDQPPRNAPPEPNTTASLGTGAKPVIAQIDAYEKQYAHWISIGNGILERYMDRRSQNAVGEFVVRKFNILWANTETLKPTLYARLPQIMVERRNKDRDPVGRIACQIAERAGNYIVQTTDFDQVMRKSVLDLLLPGRASAWVDYVVKGTGEGAQFIKSYEAIQPEYVAWKDFGHDPVRTWEEVKRVWRVVYMTRDQLEARWGKETADKIPLDRKAEDAGDHTDTVIPQATIYKVYNKEAGKIQWLHKQLPDFLEEMDPPVALEGFWPCARPLYATLSNETLVPVSLFYMYQDQADELDKITNRIGRCVDALKIVGVYNPDVAALQMILHPAGSPDNVMIPVPTWNAFREAGGLGAAFELIPLKDLAATLLSLYQARDQVLATIYQITGLSDIIRGASDPNETATAQSIKSQYGSLRIRDMQAEFALVPLVVVAKGPAQKLGIAGLIRIVPLTEGVHMAVGPAEGDLEHVVELRQLDGGRHQQPAPDGRADVL